MILRCPRCCRTRKRWPLFSVCGDCRRDHQLHVDRMEDDLLRDDLIRSGRSKELVE